MEPFQTPLDPALAPPPTPMRWWFRAVLASMILVVALLVGDILLGVLVNLNVHSSNEAHSIGLLLGERMVQATFIGIPVIWLWFVGFRLLVAGAPASGNRRPSMLWAIMAPAVVGVGLSTLFPLQPHHSFTLQNAAEEMNRAGPRMVDVHTRFDGATASDHVLTYRYTIIGNDDWLIKHLDELAAKKTAKMRAEFGSMGLHGNAMIYEYHDDAGRVVMTCRVDL